MTYPKYRIGKDTLRIEVLEVINILESEHKIVLTNKQRTSLEITMFHTLQFNQDLQWEDSKNVYLVSNALELVEIYLLRSKVYKRLGYDKEFPEIVEGISFDTYDENAAILYTKKEGKITGTCRIIFDTEKKLPIDKNYSLNDMRQSGQVFAELSRLIIDKDEKRGLRQEFRYLASGVYYMMNFNEMTRIVSVIMKEHFTLYEKFGGFVQKALLSNYGELKKPFVITTWDITKVSHFFKRGFLGIHE